MSNKTLDNAALVWYIYSIVSGTVVPETKEARLRRFKKQFDEVSDWLEKYRVKVNLKWGADDQYDPSDKTITINSRQGAEVRYYTLLHECGHVLIANHWKDFDREHPMYAASTDLRTAKSKAYRVSVIAEELEAWKRGRRLAKKLKHKIDDKKFDELITNNVMSYIEWASVGEGGY